MVHVEVSCIIHAPKEKVYEINANYACWPQAFPHIKSVRLISEKGNERHLESTVMNLKGKTHVVRSVQRIVSPDRIEEEVLANRGLTVKIIYNYQTTPEGTHIVVTNCLQPRHNNILYRAATFLLKRQLVNRLNRSIQSTLELEKKTAEME